MCRIPVSLCIFWCVVSVAGCSGCDEDDGSGFIRFDAATTDSGPDGDADVPVDSGADPGSELDCTDGVDDDLDGMPDCADPDCDAIVMCVPAPAEEWSAPGVLAAGATTEPCAAPYGDETYLGHGEPSGEPATCTACSCSNPVSNGCWIAPSVCQKSGGCAGNCDAGSIQGSGCVEAAGASNSNIPRTGLADSGSCQAATSTPTVESPSRGREGRVCSSTPTAAIGCGTSEICVVRPIAPAPSCVVHAGDVTCPAGYEGSREVFYGAFDDERSCSACSCGYSSSGCTATFTAYSAPGCSGTATPIAMDACYGGDPASYFISASSPIDPSCTLQGGGAPVGEVHGATPSTVCCTP